MKFCINCKLLSLNDVSDVDVCNQEVTVESGAQYRYNKLCICTGGRPKVAANDRFSLLLVTCYAKFAYVHLLSFNRFLVP